MSNRAERKQDLKHKIHRVIFEAETPEGKVFDVVLIVAILTSVIVVMLETTDSIKQRAGNLLYSIEWVLTIFFTLEYFLRLYSVKKPLKYATSFYGIIDLLAILPTYISVFIVGAQSLIVIRVLRLMRIFRVFKLVNYMYQGRVIAESLRKSSQKIAVFILFVLLMVVIIGSVMYLVEGSQNQEFDSIGRSVYWAIVTLTTVGYGDISPVTPLGQFIAACVMILGYSVIAVPTGIITAEMARSSFANLSSTVACPTCGCEGHADNAQFCYKCGSDLDD